MSDLFDDGGDRGHLTRGTYTASVACFFVLLIYFCRVLFVEKDRRLLIRCCFFFKSTLIYADSDEECNGADVLASQSGCIVLNRRTDKTRVLKPL